MKVKAKPRANPAPLVSYARLHIVVPGTEPPSPSATSARECVRAHLRHSKEKEEEEEEGRSCACNARKEEKEVDLGIAQRSLSPPLLLLLLRHRRAPFLMQRGPLEPRHFH